MILCFTCQLWVRAAVRVGACRKVYTSYRFYIAQLRRAFDCSNDIKQMCDCFTLAWFDSIAVFVWQ